MKTAPLPTPTRQHPGVRRQLKPALAVSIIRFDSSGDGHHLGEANLDPAKWRAFAAKHRDPAAALAAIVNAPRRLLGKWIEFTVDGDILRRLEAIAERTGRTVDQVVQAWVDAESRMVEVQLEADAVALIERIARQEGVSVSDLVRGAFEASAASTTTGPELDIVLAMLRSLARLSTATAESKARCKGLARKLLSSAQPRARVAMPVPSGLCAAKKPAKRSTKSGRPTLGRLRR